MRSMTFECDRGEKKTSICVCHSFKEISCHFHGSSETTIKKTFLKFFFNGSVPHYHKDKQIVNVFTFLSC